MENYHRLLKDLGEVLAENDVCVIRNEGEGVYSAFFLREKLEVLVQKTDLAEFVIDSTGDDFSHKVCDRCFKYLPTASAFENNRIKKGGKITKRPSCRTCRKIKNGVAVSRADRQAWEAKKPKDYSPFTCPICDRTTLAGVTKVVLDHCHKTGVVRGWVCESCNTGIGRFDDDADVIRRAVLWVS